MPTTTAAQRRAHAKVGYDAFLAGCPSRQLLDRISDKWVVLILAALGSDSPHHHATLHAGKPRSMRYSEICRRLAGTVRSRLRRRALPGPRDVSPPFQIRTNAMTCGYYRTSSPVAALPMIMRWISEVPSKMVKILASRCQRSTGYSRV
jgi:hypothetical protein